MAAMTYTTLVAAKTAAGSIANWVNANIPSDEILSDAQSDIYQRLRVREMQTRATLAVALGASTVALPSDYLNFRALLDQYGCAIRKRSERVLEMMKAYDSSGNLTSGVITNCADDGTTLYFDVQASVAVSFTLLYHRLPADLSATNLTNFLTGRYRTLLKAACLVRAYQWLKKAEGIADAKQDREAAFQTAEAMDDIDMNTQFDPREFNYVE